MPIPNSLDDLSPVETLNSPQGGDQVGGNVDNYFRAHATIMKRDLAPALTAEGTKVTPAGNIAATNTQAALAELDTAVGAAKTAATDALNAHKTSSDHDTRYYTKTQMDVSLSGKQPAGSYVANNTPAAGAVTIGWSGNPYLTLGANAWTLWTSFNFDPASKANAGATCVHTSGILEFGAVGQVGDYTVQCPSPWIMVGLRRDGTGALYIRGVQLGNQ